MIASACVANAGEFTISVKASSYALVTGDNGQTMLLSHGSPACGDGLDNDADGFVDSAEDTGCGSAQDASERLSGTQAYEPTRIPVDIAANGTITGDPAELQAQPSESCFDMGTDGIWCMAMTFTGVAGPVTGTFDSANNQITLPLPMTIQLDAVTGFPGLAAACSIGPIDATFVADNYDTVTGQATLYATDIPVPATSNCGSSYNDLVNAYSALPGTVEMQLNTTILNASGQPIAVS